MPLLNSAKGFLLDLIFPIRCIKCREFSAAYVCDNCLQAINWSTEHYCLFCNARASYKNICLNCLQKKSCGLVACLAPASYKDPLPRSMISCLKYRFVKDIAFQMSDMMVKYIGYRISQGLMEFDSNTVVTAVPLSPKRYRWRGFNQADMLAKYFSKNFSLTYIDDAISRNIFLRPQVEIAERKDRAENVKDSFVCTNQETVKGKSVLLIDDVATTGATLNECAKELKKAEAKEVIGLVFARG